MGVELLVYAAGAMAAFFIIKIVISVTMSILKMVGNVLAFPLKVTGIWYIARWLFDTGGDGASDSDSSSIPGYFPVYRTVRHNSASRPIGKVVMNGVEFYLFGLEVFDYTKYRVRYSVSKVDSNIRESISWISTTKVRYF